MSADHTAGRSSTKAKSKQSSKRPPNWATAFVLDQAPPDPSAERLVCTISGSRARYISADESFAIWSAMWEEGGLEREVTLKGALARVNSGEMLVCVGKWKKHPQYGWSFDVTDYRASLPQSDMGVAKWLEARVNGIGPVFAKAIVKHFGADKVFATLDGNPELLREIRTEAGRKLPDSQIDKAIAAWDDVKAIREIETFLFSHGASASLAAKLYKRYGSEVVLIIQENPYQITEVHGVGFSTADTIAKNLWTDKSDPRSFYEDPRRLIAGMLHVLEEGARQGGHVFLSLKQIRELSAKLLDVGDQRLIVNALQSLVENSSVVVEDDEIYQQRIYLKRFHNMECQLARHLRSLVATKVSPLFPQSDCPIAPKNLSPEEVEALILPSEAQWSVVQMVRVSPVSLLTGGPGVGKTATTKQIVERAVAARKIVRLCAPTGKAARRMAQLTGHEASTIHRLLEYSPFEGGFQRNEDNPIEADLIVLDEASMLSLSLADRFFNAVSPGTHVLLVGDPDQLPPIEAGKVLADLIASQTIPRVHLAKIFRQAAKSMIVQNSRRVNKGQVPFFRQEEAERELGQKMAADFYWVTKKTPDETRELVVDMVVNRLPRTFKLNPLTDIMVLVPQHRGACGLDILNQELEERLNPGDKKQVVVAKRGIHVGSRIVQSKNDYTHEIMNGELAIVLDYNDTDKTAKLSLDEGGREIWVPVSDMDTFHLAYAISIHRSQGSEFKCVVCPVSTAHYQMLSRSLTYTAITRASELCLLVGEKKALHMAVSKVDTKKRNSSLIQRLHDPAESGELF